ncbi:MAG TPA: ABC transporter permease [Pirellulales bacterium]|nr:ABC transporter permease [Pirellulales bacterium]
MLSYLIRRVLIGCLTLLLITFIVYGLIRSMPGSPLTVQMAEMDPSRKIRPEDYARMQKSFGLDKPWWQAYGVWLGNVARLDFGRSFLQKQPVAKVIGERIGPTLLLSLTSLLLAYLLSIPMGLYATVRNGHHDERFLSTALYMLYSFPTFVTALLLQMLLAVKLELLPLFDMHSQGYEQMSSWEQAWDLFKHALMPVACYTYGSLAYESRFIRANMQEVMKQDYIRTARAKGVGPLAVIFHHAFRNTLIPFVTLIGLTLPTLLSGSVIIEQIFTWPGLGRLFFESISARDYPTIMGLTLVFSVMTLLGTLVADILYAVVDPRISYS